MSISRNCVAVAVMLLGSLPAVAATPKEIDAAIQLGAGYLKDLFKSAEPRQLRSGANGVGPAALAGLALLECGAPHSDPSVRAITAAVRDASFTAAQTYQISLCLLYLDRFGDPADVPLIQMLGVRLLAGQSASGGWTYDCIDSVSVPDERDLRSALLGKTAPPVGPLVRPGAAERLNPEIERYQKRIAAPLGRQRIDDNSNTQFGILGVWTARKHGVSVEAALDLIEKRFLNSQTSSGGWPYVGSKAGSPSMTCVGLLGLATAIARREERRLPDDPGKSPPGNSPRTPAKAPPPLARAPTDDRDRAVQKALSALGPVLAGRGKGQRFVINGSAAPGDRDLYFLWSVERVATLFGLDRIAGIDWYDVGAEELVAGQNISGSWGRGGKGAEIDTAFAILFLVRSNLLQDLNVTLQKGGFTVEMRSAPRPGDQPAPAAAANPGLPGERAPGEATQPRRPNVTVIRPNSTPPSAEDPKKLADELVGSLGLEWGAALSKAKDARGTAYTQALVLAIGRLEGDRLKQAREALAERLTRMTADTLRTLAKDNEAELRRATVLAMGMKDDKTFIPDLIAALEDEDVVAHAAHAGLKSLTGKDFGPAAKATSPERKAAVAAWKQWWAQQKR